MKSPRCNGSPSGVVSAPGLHLLLSTMGQPDQAVGLASEADLGLACRLFHMQDPACGTGGGANDPKGCGEDQYKNLQ